MQLYPLLLQFASGELNLHDLKSVPPVYIPECRTVIPVYKFLGDFFGSFDHEAVTTYQ